MGLSHGQIWLCVIFEFLKEECVYYMHTSNLPGYLKNTDEVLLVTI